MAIRVACILILAATLGGCTGLTPTPSLTAYVPEYGYRYDNVAGDGEARKNAEELFVFLSISGGGTRAAALGYGVMERLRDAKITWRGEERSLLQEVDVISGVSGGAFPAAYYVAFGDLLFEDFGQRFLYRNVSRDLGLRMLKWPKWIPDPQFGRSDVAASWYDRKIFRGVTYGDLLERKDAPFLVINGTDMAAVSSFAFTQAQFDLICADLSQMTLARAVAASSAFPFLLSPVTLQNRAGSCDYAQTAVAPTATDDSVQYSDLDDDKKIALAYRDAATRPYIHILDGGVSDYLGFRTALREVDRGPMGWNLSQAVATGRIEKLVVIIVDAWTGTAPSDSDSAEPPGIVEAIETLAYRAVDGSRDSRPVLRDWLARAGLPEGPPYSYYIHVGFDQLPSPERRDRFKRIPASFELPRSDIDDLRLVGAELLDRSNEFRQLLDDL